MTTPIFAVDPGSEESAYVVFDERLIAHDKVLNRELLDVLSQQPMSRLLVIESTKPFAIQMNSGKSMFPSQVYDTAIWIGRFIERWSWSGRAHVLMDRRAIKMALLGVPNGTDATVRAAVVDHYGFNDLNKAKGTKHQPGPLYGVTADRMQALALALAAIQMRDRDGGFIAASL